jgi:hypothetical protein
LGSIVLLLKELIFVFRGWWAFWFDRHVFEEKAVTDS